ALFGKSDDEDEGGTVEPAAPAPAPKATAVADAATAAKPAPAVPLPRMRPAIYQVASATNDTSIVKPAGKPGAPQTIADIINSRGLWSDDKAAKQPTE